MSPWQACSPHFQSIIKPGFVRPGPWSQYVFQSPTSTISGKCKTYEWKGLLSNTLSLTFWLNYQSNDSNYMSLLNYIILYLAKLLKWFTTGGFSLRPNNHSQWLRSEVCWSAWPFCLSTRLSAKKRENKYVLISMLTLTSNGLHSISFLIIFKSFSHYVPHENCHNLLIYPLVLHLVDCRKSATLSATGPAGKSPN